MKIVKVEIIIYSIKPMKNIKCKKCGNEMKYLGNISGVIYTSYPPQWDAVYACMNCKEKQTIRERGEIEPDNYFINDFKEQI